MGRYKSGKTGMTKEEFQNKFTELTDFPKNRFHPLAWISGDPVIGENVYISGFSEIYAKGAEVIIGDNCDIASFVAINCSDSHKYDLGLSDEIQREDIVIENDVYIGTHSFIGGGTYIGHHSVIGAGTIVPKGIYPPYTLIVGNPAVIKPGYYWRKAKEEKKPIPHNRPTLGLEEANAAKKVLIKAKVSQGEEVQKFEKELCEYLGLEDGHALAVSSGTAALYMAIRAMENRGTFSNIGVPAYSCTALKNAVRMAGKTPVFLDTDGISPNIDFQASRKKAEYFIACHMYGMPTRLCGANVIEDCAQAIGALVDGKPVGTQTDFSIFSFYATKPITSGGQGGMVVARKKEDIEFLRDLRDFDQKNDEILRFNLQMTDLQAAVGRKQLERLPVFLGRRKELAERYINSGINLWHPCEGSNWYRGMIESRNPKRLAEYLLNNNIKSILPIENMEIMADRETVPNAYILSEKLLSIPLYPSLDNKTQDIVISALKKYILIEGGL